MWISRERFEQLESELATARAEVLSASKEAARASGELQTLRPLLEFSLQEKKDLLDRLAAAMGVRPLHNPPSITEMTQLGFDPPGMEEASKEPVSTSNQIGDWVSEAQKIENELFHDERLKRLQEFASRRAVEMNEKPTAEPSLVESAA